MNLMLAMYDRQFLCLPQANDSHRGICQLYRDTNGHQKEMFVPPTPVKIGFRFPREFENLYNIIHD